MRAEKRSGTTTEGRDALRTILDFLQQGDVLMVTRIDRRPRRSRSAGRRFIGCSGGHRLADRVLGGTGWLIGCSGAPAG
jgi:hypothetical protein